MFLFISLDYGIQYRVIQSNAEDGRSRWFAGCALCPAVIARTRETGPWSDRHTARNPAAAGNMARYSGTAEGRPDLDQGISGILWSVKRAARPAGRDSGGGGDFGLHWQGAGPRSAAAVALSCFSGAQHGAADQYGGPRPSQQAIPDDLLLSFGPELGRHCSDGADASVLLRACASSCGHLQ